VGRNEFASLEKHFPGQLSQSIGFRCFDENAAFENRAEFHKGQAMVFLHQQPEAVCDSNF